MSNINIPTSASDRQKLKTMLVEMTHCMQRADDEKEAMKEIGAEASKQFDVPKKIINKLARTMYKHNYADLQAENEDFELLYETLISAQSKEVA